MTTAEDHETIRSFANWVTNDIVLPIDPAEYAQLKTALTWAKRERRKLGLERIALYEIGEALDEDDMFAKHDAYSLTTFLNAVERQVVDIETQDRKKLAAWNKGEPIRDKETPYVE